MNTGQVVEVVDTGVVPLPPPSQELDEKSTGVRTAPKPLAISQPDGASFTINGQEIRWQKWRFRYTMHPREGLVLHTVGYEDGDACGRSSTAPRSPRWSCPTATPIRTGAGARAFDVGEYGVGRLASSIEPNTDAPANATLLDATFADDDGQAVDAAAGGRHLRARRRLLWKHYDMYSETERVAPRARAGRLLHRHHRQLRLRDQLDLPSGRRARGGCGADRHHAAERRQGDHGGRPRRRVPSGISSRANVVAPHHQHFFNFRLDFDVDGPNNSVHEMNTRAAPPGPDNPVAQRDDHGRDGARRARRQRSAR